MFIGSVLLLAAVIAAVVLGMTGVSAVLLTLGHALLWVSLTMLLAFFVAGIIVGRETARDSEGAPSKPT